MLVLHMKETAILLRQLLFAHNIIYNQALNPISNIGFPICPRGH